MPRPSRTRPLSHSVVLALVALVTLPAPMLAVRPAHAEIALPPEKNPPGDIPDSQVFVDYANTDGGYALKAPEGWARAVAGPDVRFSDKLDAVSVTISLRTDAPTLANVKATYVPDMVAAGRAVTVASVSEVTLPAGPAILIAYGVNSDPNPVTMKQVRLEAQRYLIFRAGRMAVLDLSAPAGADNVDQWRLMSRSFGWR